MGLLNRDTDYAVRALCFIAGHKKKMVSVSALVRELSIPRPFLRKILQKLNRKGTLKSYRGKGGGFQLSVSPYRIFLVDLIMLFQGSLKINECFFRKRLCPNRSICRLKRKIDAIERRVIMELRSVTISSLIKGGDGR